MKQFSGALSIMLVKRFHIKKDFSVPTSLTGYAFNLWFYHRHQTDIILTVCDHIE